MKTSNQQWNCKAEASLRRSLTVVRVVLWIGIVLIPIGVVCFMIMFKDLNNETMQIIGLSGLGAIAVGAGAIMLMLGDRSKYRRGLALLDQAAQFGLQYIYKAPTAASRMLREMRLFSDADNYSAMHLMKGEHLGLNLNIMDYSQAWTTPNPGAPSMTKTDSQTIVYAEEAVPEVPDFFIFPRSWFENILLKIFGKSLEIPGQTSFNKAYALIGNDKQAVLRLFSPSLISLCMENKDLSIEVNDGNALIYHRNKIVEPNAYPLLIERAVELITALKGATSPTA